MLYEVSRKEGHVVLFGICNDVYVVTRARSMDKRCRQCPKRAPVNACHLRVFFESPNSHDIVVTRIDASFKPGKWTCMYDVERSKHGPAFHLYDDFIESEHGSHHYYLPTAPVEVMEYFDRLRDKGALHHLVNDPDAIPEVDDEDPRLLDDLVHEDLRQQTQEETDDEENQTSDQDYHYT